MRFCRKPIFFGLGTLWLYLPPFLLFTCAYKCSGVTGCWMLLADLFQLLPFLASISLPTQGSEQTQEITSVVKKFICFHIQRLWGCGLRVLTSDVKSSFSDCKLRSLAGGESVRMVRLGWLLGWLHSLSKVRNNPQHPQPPGLCVFQWSQVAVAPRLARKGDLWPDYEH